MRIVCTDGGAFVLTIAEGDLICKTLERPLSLLR